MFCFSACTKIDSPAIRSDAISNSSVQFIDTVRIPINDLGTGTYLGFTGGLYPGGVDTPSGQYALDLKDFASRIVPLDTAGNHSITGKVVFISLGGSTGGKNMVALKDKTTGNAATNPYLLMVSCNNGYGSGSLNSIMNPIDPYWDHVDIVLKGAHIGYRQVQVIYLETEDSTQLKVFPGRAYRVRNELEASMRVFKTKFPNIKLVYLLGRTTTFKTQVPNVEPMPYYFGWGCKFMIQDQINGVAGTEYKGDSAVAPMVAWGWYQWADGTPIPRQDGFVWLQSETSDGLHATEAGQDTLSTRFQNFLLTDRYANTWYANHVKPGIVP